MPVGRHDAQNGSFNRGNMSPKLFKATEITPAHAVADNAGELNTEADAAA